MYILKNAAPILILVANVIACDSNADVEITIKTKKVDTNKEETRQKALCLIHIMENFIDYQRDYVYSVGKVGSWEKIDYSPNILSSTKYCSPFTFKEINQNNVVGVVGTSHTELADCPTNSNWILRCQYEEFKLIECTCTIQSDNKKACGNIIPEMLDFSSACYNFKSKKVF